VILVDTSVWIDHFRNSNARLASLLENELVLTHPFVVGELTCGSLPSRTRVIADLMVLPALAQASHHDVMHFVEQRKLWGKGIGWIDVHLLATTILAKCQIWTLDKALHAAAKTLRIDWNDER
jgi:predicted nucleic acid-binding protein